MDCFFRGFPEEALTRSKKYEHLWLLKYAAKMFFQKGQPIYNVISHTAEDPLHCLVPSITVKTAWNLTKTEVSKC